MNLQRNIIKRKEKKKINSKVKEKKPPKPTDQQTASGVALSKNQYYVYIISTSSKEQKKKKWLSRAQLIPVNLSLITEVLSICRLWWTKNQTLANENPVSVGLQNINLEHLLRKTLARLSVSLPSFGPF